MAHKLCGAGNGGFFLVFSRRDSLKLNYFIVKIQVEANELKGKYYENPFDDYIKSLEGAHIKQEFSNFRRLGICTKKLLF